MARKYELKQRAKSQEQTRRKIVEAAVELHGTVGPARTTLSDVARLAGVQRHTLYRHFPDEWALGLACSAHYTEANPLPDPEPWRAVADPAERLRRALPELYAFYERTEPMQANVLRDAEVSPPVRLAVELRMGEPLRAIRDALADGLPGPDALVLLDLALDFYTWRRLVRGGGLSSADAAGLMARSVLCAGSEPGE